MQTVVVKILLFTCFVVCLSQKNNLQNNHAAISKKTEASKDITDKRKIIRLAPNPSYDGNIVIESYVPDALSFYLFDKEANLIRQVTLKGNSSSVLYKLKKGSYVYDVFLNAESIESGNIEVK